jgi:hypothetical protein
MSSDLSFLVCGIPHLTQRARQIWGTQDLLSGSTAGNLFRSQVLAQLLILDKQVADDALQRLDASC